MKISTIQPFSTTATKRRFISSGAAIIANGARAASKRVLTASVRSRLVPLLRAYLRFMPVGLGKRSLWRRLIVPYFGWLSHEFMASTRFGARMRGNSQDFIQRHLYYFGLWEPNLTKFLAERLRPGDAFVDVGANVGYFSLQAARLVGDQGRVVAIEASPSLYARLLENLALNAVRNVRALNVAAADRTGRLRLYHGPADNQGGSTLLASATSGATFECEVAAQPLAALVTREEWRRARVIKIDVEGAEAAVAEGMAALLADARPDLEVVMEIAPHLLAKQGRRAQDILALFGAAGFHAYRLENDYSSSAGGYLGPITQHRPARITGPLTIQTDVVFSRIDGPVLGAAARP
jgi:FkbM family methyltransferase